MRNWIVTVAVVCLAGFSLKTYSQTPRDLTREGNRLFKKGEYQTADSLYRIASRMDTVFFESAYNSGNASYLNQDMQGAMESWQSSYRRAEDAPQKEKASYNLGVASLDGKNYQAAIESFKEALRHNPSNEQARYNLALAQKLLEQQQQQQDQNQDQSQNQNQNQNQNNPQNNPDNSDRQNPDSNPPQDDSSDRQQNDQPESDGNDDSQQNDSDQPQNQPPQTVQGRISPEDMNRLLEALDKQEEKTQQKANEQKQEGSPRSREKDW